MPDKAREFHDEILPKDSAKLAHFCSMKITKNVREYAKQGMENKAEEFKKSGLEIYRKA